MPGLTDLLGGLMGGGGGAPGGGGPMPMGAPPGLGGGDPMQALMGLQEQPAPDGEDQALQDASLKIGMAYSRIQMRSPKAAKLLADASSKVQQAREALKQEGSRPLGAPPSLGMAEQGMGF